MGTVFGFTQHPILSPESPTRGLATIFQTLSLFTETQFYHQRTE